MHRTRISYDVSRAIYKDRMFRYPKSRSDALDIFYKTLFNMLVDQPTIDWQLMRSLSNPSTHS